MKMLKKMLMTGLRAPLFLLMGNVGDGLSVRERIDKEAEEAELELAGLGKVPDTPPASDEPGTPPPAPIVPPVEPPSDASTQEIAQLKALLEKERHRNDSLEGRIRAQTEDYRQIKEQLAELKTAVKPPEPPKPPTPAVDKQKLLDDIGEEGVKLFDEQQSKLQDLETANAELRALIQSTQGTTEELKAAQTATTTNSFFSSLSSIVPEWKQLNGWGDTPGDPKFMAFLDEKISDLSEDTYDDLLKKYSKTGEVGKVAAIFQKFKAAQTAPAERPSLEQHLDPGITGKGAPPPQPQIKKTYTWAEVNKLENDIIKGKADSGDPKINALWEEHQTAVSEGRVR
jgi:hypothetical protein